MFCYVLHTTKRKKESISQPVFKTKSYFTKSVVTFMAEIGDATGLDNIRSVTERRFVNEKR